MLKILTISDFLFADASGHQLDKIINQSVHGIAGGHILDTSGVNAFNF